MSMSRAGQSTVEYVLVIAVFVIAIASFGFWLAPHIGVSLLTLGERAETVYTDSSITQ
jgi:hypothetical protein